jgi:DNA-binding HxlR family transcriptional regulator
MKTYGQYCALAKALDVVGDRWTLLIVRELLLRGPSRYTDLRYGLPGVATNLLVERLRELEAAGIVRREEAPPPVATALFHLTERGEQLRPVLLALGEWGAAFMGPRGEDDAFRSHWLAFPVEHFLTDNAPDQPPISIELRTGDRPMLVETVDGGVRARPGTAGHPDALLDGPPELVLAVLKGRIDLFEAQARGLSFAGDPNALRRLQPDGEAEPAPDR